jgi:ketosteroid isomerase-like protein
MALTKAHVRKVLDIYFRAWTTQDPDLIVTIFTPTATYQERILEQPVRNEAGIREYWDMRVVNGQANIEVQLLNLYLDGTTAVAEWEVHFDEVADGNRKRMLEVALLEFEGDRIASLREYWSAEVTEQVQ